MRVCDVTVQKLEEDGWTEERLKGVPLQRIQRHEDGSLSYRGPDGVVKAWDIDNFRVTPE